MISYENYIDIFTVDLKGNLLWYYSNLSAGWVYVGGVILSGINPLIHIASVRFLDRINSYDSSHTFRSRITFRKYGIIFLKLSEVTNIFPVYAESVTEISYLMSILLIEILFIMIILFIQIIGSIILDLLSRINFNRLSHALALKTLSTFCASIIMEELISISRTSNRMDLSIWWKNQNWSSSLINWSNSTLTS